MIKAFLHHISAWWASQSPDNRPRYMTFNTFLQR